MKRIKIFSTHKVNNAYSCLFYLRDELEKRTNCVVELWAASPCDEINGEMKKNYHSLCVGSITDKKIIGGIITRLKMFFVSLSADIIIINDLEFFKLSYFIKKIFSSKKIVLYNTELYGEGIPCRKEMMDFYKKHASFPDITVECLQERANYRNNKFNINKKIYVINNTLPIQKKEVNNNSTIEKYLDFSNDNPIMIYAGGCSLSRGLQAIIPLIEDFENKINFLLFCYGKENDFNKIKSLCAGKSNCHLYPAVDKDVLFEVMKKCDIGIQYYNPDVNLNNRFAAPSKFFEYMSIGLNVLSTNNEGINRIINENGIGVCFENDEEISAALNILLCKGLDNKNKIKKIFNEKYCYEIDSQEAVDAIIELINQ